MNRTDYNGCVDEFGDRLYTYALHMVHQKTEAEDIVQESFIKLWNRRKDVDQKTVKAYLYRIVHNACLDYFKKKKSQPMLEVQLDHLHTPSSNSTFESQDYINHLLNKMDAQSRSLLLLRDYEGYSYDEIGNLVELSPAQVKVYLFRARKKIQALAKKINYT